jgi:hypothetical protein
MSKFIGFATPRSGTAWLSNFLTYGEHSFCRHEALFGCESFTDFEGSIERLKTTVKGSIETAAPFLAQNMYNKFRKTHKFFIVVRHAAEVDVSLTRLKLDTTMLRDTYDGLEMLVEHCPGIPVLGYETLFQYDTLSSLWDYLEIPAPFPFQRLEMLREILVEDGLSKGFGRFASEENVKIAAEGFKRMYRDLGPKQIYDARILN